MMITKKQFLTFEVIRRSGKTNMFIVKNVIALSGHILDTKMCSEITKNYNTLSQKYK